MILVRGPEHDNDINCEKDIDKLVDDGYKDYFIQSGRHGKLNWNQERVVDRQNYYEKIPSYFKSFVRGESEIEYPLPPSHVLVDLHF